jgi:hypothetical protein
MTHENESTPRDKAKVLVTGATGMQGGAVVQALLRAGHPVTALVRNPSAAPAQALAEQGVALVTGDLEDPASLQATSVGHDAVFSVQLAGVDPADPGAEVRQATSSPRPSVPASLRSCTRRCRRPAGAPITRRWRRPTR